MSQFTAHLLRSMRNDLLLHLTSRPDPEVNRPEALLRLRAVQRPRAQFADLLWRRGYEAERERLRALAVSQRMAAPMAKEVA